MTKEITILEKRIARYTKEILDDRSFMERYLSDDVNQQLIDSTNALTAFNENVISESKAQILKLQSITLEVK